MLCSVMSDSLWLHGLEPTRNVHGISRQEYCSGLPFPSPGDLPQPEIKPVSLVSPELADDSLPIEPLGKPPYIEWHLFIFYSNILLAFANLISPRYMVCSMKSGPILRNTRGWSPTAKAPQTSHQVPYGSLSRCTSLLPPGGGEEGCL